MKAKYQSIIDKYSTDTGTYAEAIHNSQCESLVAELEQAFLKAYVLRLRAAIKAQLKELQKPENAINEGEIHDTNIAIRTLNNVLQMIDELQ